MIKLLCHANEDEVPSLQYVLQNPGDNHKWTVFEGALFLNTERSSASAEETFIGSLLPSQRFVDKTSGRSLKDRPVFPGDACLTPNRGCAASPNLFRFNTRDSLSEGGGRDNETERGGGGRGGSQNRFGPHNYTAAGWRSVVWSHGCGSLQQTPQAISNSSIAPWNILC